MTNAKVRFLRALVVALAACEPSPEEQAVRRWLLCEECTRQELDSVVALGEEVTPLLIEALEGPSERSRENIRRQAEERYRGLRSPSDSLAEFVDHYDSNYVAHYRAHAAIALAQISAPEARVALSQAMRQDSSYSQDVLRSIAAAAPLVLVPAAGARQAAPRDSFVRVNPTVVARHSITGRPLAGVEVVFTVDSGGGRVIDSVQRTDSSGRASVRWALGPGPDSLNVLRATAFRRTARFRAMAHGLAPRHVGRSVNAQLSLVAGDSQHAPLDSFVKVNPAVSVQNFVTGAGLERVRVVFFVDSGRGRVFDSVEFTDTAGRAEVRWQLGPQPQDSINLLRAVAAGRTVRFHARAHTPELRVVFVVQPRNARVGEPFVPPVRIEVHDAWGATQTQIFQAATVTVVGDTISSVHRVAAGVAQMPRLTLPKPGTNIVLRAQVPGAEPALSAPFDILP